MAATRASAMVSGVSDMGARDSGLGVRDSGLGIRGSGLGIPGISEDALTPELREAVARLAAERDRLRDELARARGRIVTLERLADEDALAPVANRRAFVRQLTRMIAFTQRYGVPASIVYFDVNNMKQINDAYGHPAGDAALREALANAVVHGCKGDPEKKIECCVACDETRGVLIVIRDPGQGFDPDTIPSPIHGQNIFETHGRGIYLINQLMDEVRFERGGTEIHMIKR